MVDDKKIRDEITKEVFPLFAMGKFDSALPTLQSKYLRYYHETNDIETKRFISFHICVAKYNDTRDIEGMKLYIKELITDMNSIEGYKENYVSNYNRALNYYRLAFDNELNLNEKIAICNYIVESYKSIKMDEGDMQIARFNLDLLKNDFDDILSIVVELHNSDIDEFYLNSILKSLSNLDDKTCYYKAQKIVDKNNLINL
jgi:hypothetical protein